MQCLIYNRIKTRRSTDFVSQSQHFVLLQLMRLQTTSRHTETVLFVRVQMRLSKLGNKIDQPIGDYIHRYTRYWICAL